MACINKESHSFTCDPHDLNNTVQETIWQRKSKEHQIPTGDKHKLYEDDDVTAH